MAGGGGQRSSEKVHIASRRSKIAAMLISGITNQFEIASRLGMDDVVQGQKTVSRDIIWIRNEWKLKAIEDWDSFVGQELARIDKLEKEAWEAWEVSKKTRKKTRSRTRMGRRGKTHSEEDAEEVGMEQRDGDPRFLDLVLSCIDKRCKLLQLELKPGKDRSGLGANPGGGSSKSAMPVEEFRKLPMEERIAILMSQSRGSVN